jgi:hypothetical protein
LVFLNPKGFSQLREAATVMLGGIQLLQKHVFTHRHQALGDVKKGSGFAASFRGAT